MTRTIRTVIIGGGLSGITQAIRLKKELGDRVQITILEKKGSPGGVWRDSIWPEAGVDVPIHLYTLETDLETDWREYFAFQPDVLAYWLRLVDKYELRDSFVFNSEYVGSHWDERTQTHSVTIRNTKTKAQTDITTEVLISATGPLAKRKFPNVPGLKEFKGAWFHNLDWDGSVKLEGKRIAVVGNGSSGVQIVPGLAKLPGTQVTHYIRSGGYFIPKIQREYTPWERFAFQWIPGYLRWHRFGILQEHDRHWSIKFQGNDKQRVQDERELLAYLRAKAPAKYLDALTPTWPLGTKRPPLDLGWLDSLHWDNVELVNGPLESVDATGITVNGQHRDHDIIVYATGSDIGAHGLGANTRLFGEGNLELEQYWTSIGGPQAYAGIAVPRFPNYFTIIGPNSVAGSWGYTALRETAAVARIVREILDYGLSSVQPKQAVFEHESEEIQKELNKATIAVAGVDNYWRSPGGRITVNSPLSGLGLWWRTQRTRWGDWDAVRLVKGSDGKTRLQHVDVLAIKRRRAAVKAIILAALGATLYKRWDAVVAAFEWAVKESGADKLLQHIRA